MIVLKMQMSNNYITVGKYFCLNDLSNIINSFKARFATSKMNTNTSKNITVIGQNDFAPIRKSFKSPDVFFFKGTKWVSRNDSHKRWR